MDPRRPAGLETSSQKYDILTALGALALAGPPGGQRLTLRFLTLITARYNWRQRRLSVGQREIARLWSVDERTVKREMAKLRALGWIVLETAARRGSVATYSLDLPTVLAATRPSWANVGADFEARMDAIFDPGRDDTVVPFPNRGAEVRAAEEDPAGAEEPWTRIRQNLRAEDPAIFANWFEGLRSRGRAGDELILVASSPFHASYIRTHFADRLLRAAQGTAGVRGLSILAAPGEEKDPAAGG